MRLPRSEVERVMRESRDHDEAAKNILDLCRNNLNINNNNDDIINSDDDNRSLSSISEDGNQLHVQHWNHNTRPNPQHPKVRDVASLLFSIICFL